MIDRDYVLDDYSKANLVITELKKFGFTLNEKFDTEFAPQLFIDAKAKTYYFIYNNFNKFNRHLDTCDNVIVYSEFMEMLHKHKFPFINKLGYERKGFISQEAYDIYVESMLQKAYELGVKHG